MGRGKIDIHGKWNGQKPFGNISFRDRLNFPHHILETIADYAAELIIIPLDAENVIKYCKDSDLDSWEKIILKARYKPRYA